MKLIPLSVSRTVARQLLTAQKHSPRILFVAGIGGVVVSTVLACKATLKVEETLQEIEREVSEVKTVLTTHLRSLQQIEYVANAFVR